MARSKSPAPRKAKSATKKAAPAEQPFETGVAIALVKIVACWYFSSSSEDIAKNPIGDFTNKSVEGFNVTYPWGPIPVVSKWIGTSFNLVLILHLLNSIDKNNNGGFWLNAFAQCVISTYAGKIITAIMTGENMADAIFSAAVPSLFFLWYVVVKEIPFCPHRFNWWNKYKELPVISEALPLLLELGTLLFTTGIIIGAVSGPHTVFSASWFKAIAMGAIAGTASSFFPFNKGVKFTKSEDLTNALAVSFFIASNGFEVIDYFTKAIITDITGIEIFTVGASLNSFVNGYFVDAAGFVVVATIFNTLFGDLVCKLTGFRNMNGGFDMFGIVGTLFHHAQLD